MTKLILEIPDERDLNLLLPLFLRLKIRYSSIENSLPHQEELKDAISIVQNGCNMDSFGDALNYQIETRQERPLPFR